MTVAHRALIVAVDGKRVVMYRFTRKVEHFRANVLHLHNNHIKYH